jgi:hypothetical protein
MLGQVRVPNHDVSNGGYFRSKSKNKYIAKEHVPIYKNKNYCFFMFCKTMTFGYYFIPCGVKLATFGMGWNPTS